MIDFETLGTDADAVILSLGILVFDRVSGENIEEAYLEFDISGQLLEGRTISSDTVNWWRRQNKDELARLLAEGRANHNAITSIVNDIAYRYDIEKVWSRGSMDWNILENIMGRHFPFKFWQQADVRTLDVLGQPKGQAVHNALDDCKVQVEYVARVIHGYMSSV